MAKLPEPRRTLTGEIRRDRRAARERLNSSPFFGTGVHPNGAQGLDSDNFVAGVSGFSFQGDSGNAEFNDLTLRGGIIGNDALTSPVDGSAPNVSATGFSLAQNVLTELAGVNITVPAGFTTMLCTAGATVFSYNPNTTGGSDGTGSDAIYAQVKVGAITSHANPVGVSGSGGYATSFSAAGFSLTGLTPGSTVRLGVWGTAAYAVLAANVDNYANAYASMIWLR